MIVGSLVCVPLPSRPLINYHRPQGMLSFVLIALPTSEMRIALVLFTFSGCRERRLTASNPKSQKPPVASKAQISRKALPGKDFKQQLPMASKAQISTNTLQAEPEGPTIHLPPPGEVKELVVDLEQNRAIIDYIESQDAPDVDFNRALECEKPGTHVDIGFGPGTLERDYVSDGSDSRFQLRWIYRMEECRAYRLQEKLLEYMGDGIFKLRRPKYLDEGMDYCDETIVFEESRGYKFFNNPYSPAAAARGLEILKSLHRLGIAHSRVLHGFMWEPDNVESLKLFDFFHAGFFLNVKSGKAIDANGPINDLKGFADVFLPTEYHPAFLGAIETGFDYDYWISYFKQLPSF